MSKTVRLSRISPLTIPRRWWIAGGLVAGSGLVALALALPFSAPVPTPALRPTVALPTPRAQAISAPSRRAPAVASTELRLERAVVAYAAPDGAVLGALEAGRPYTLQARIGLDWLHLEVEGSGAVWVRAEELAPQLASLPDLATPVIPPTAVVVLIAAAPPAPPTPAVTEPAAPLSSDEAPAPAPAATAESVVIVAPTVAPCTLREIGSILRPCNGVVVR